MLSMYLLLICGFIYISEMTEISYGFLYKIQAVKAMYFNKKRYLDEEDFKAVHLI